MSSPSHISNPTPEPTLVQLADYHPPPLPNDIPLPPLPPITDPGLLKLALTHSSAHQLPHRPSEIVLDESRAVDDYEKLEHVGDALLGAVVNIMLHDMFPSLKPGPATMLKSHLVKNQTLADISDRYGLPQQMRGDSSGLWVVRQQQKARASIFEAYIAGVFYSYLFEGESVEAKGGVAALATPLKPTPKAVSAVQKLQVHNPSPSKPSVPTGNHLRNSSKTKTDKPSGPPHDPFAHLLMPILAPETKSQPDEAPASPSMLSHQFDWGSLPGPPSYKRSRGDAMVYLDSWLHPLFTPIAHWYLWCMKRHAMRLETLYPRPPTPPRAPERTMEDWRAQGTNALLQSWNVGRSGGSIKYYSVLGDDEVWKVTCKLQVGGPANPAKRGVLVNVTNPSLSEQGQGEKAQDSLGQVGSRAASQQGIETQHGVNEGGTTSRREGPVVVELVDEVVREISKKLSISDNETITNVEDHENSDAEGEDNRLAVCTRSDIHLDQKSTATSVNQSNQESGETLSVTVVGHLQETLPFDPTTIPIPSSPYPQEDQGVEYEVQTPEHLSIHESTVTGAQTRQEEETSGVADRSDNKTDSLQNGNVSDAVSREEAAITSNSPLKEPSAPVVETVNAPAPRTEKIIPLPRLADISDIEVLPNGIKKGDILTANSSSVIKNRAVCNAAYQICRQVGIAHWAAVEETVVD
ncbi:hypothetical protein TREMEDRAFT_64292 [Tremella mesenterica DSM 1558]|uniref:uncharacterized protein n=1 Tax=Tremella mesenterica (strain ATCC 24925 / CBS 8224 / DSM 1558 / NBRC 9311 / NRRL Y-6157 / RJB 2259-6 / UBC 559-6) TaxID=578456 RepID=UPI0003F4949A|nr:uncharacterized protein TREMEDRAFT_64292 [Tremella mesenterica DSM 1558]EIW67697.1 hypothetical protein TREMEDRAFT_64292 [Tremella mesenterica DSM 1558]